MEKRVHTSLWSKALATMCVVAWCSFIRSDCTEISCLEVSSFNFSRFSSSFCVLRSHSKPVEASGSKWILNQILYHWLTFFSPLCSLMAPAAVSVPPFAVYRWAGWGCLAGRVLTQHRSPGSPFAFSYTSKSQRGVLILVRGHCDH